MVPAAVKGCYVRKENSAGGGSDATCGASADADRKDGAGGGGSGGGGSGGGGDGGIGGSAASRSDPVGADFAAADCSDPTVAADRETVAVECTLDDADKPCAVCGYTEDLPGEDEILLCDTAGGCGS